MPVACPAVEVDLQLGAPLGLVGHQATQLADAGATGAFTFEGPTDVFLPLVEAALAVRDDEARSRLLLYTNVAVAFPRSPVHLAHAAWDLQRLTRGRFALGLGTQVKAHVERRYGATWGDPVAHMDEIIAATRAVFATWQHGERLDFEGTCTSHSLITPLLSPPPLTDDEGGPPPIWLAAVGPKMTELAGRSADGLLVHPFHSQPQLAAQLDAVRAARLAAAGTTDGFHLGVGAIVAVGRTEAERAEADAGARGLVGFYASTPAYRPALASTGHGDLQPRLRDLIRAGRWEALDALIPDDLLDAVTIRGTPAEVADGLRARYEGVADRVALTVPHAAPPDLLAELLAALR